MNKQLSLSGAEIDHDTIRLCQQGDVSGFERIFVQYRQPLLRVALRMLGNKQDAEDAVQMTFMKLYKSIGNFNFAARFSTYLFRILVNSCYDLLEKRKRMMLQDLDCVDPSYSPDGDMKIQLERAILQLPERMRVCFVLFAVEEVKQTEIAEILKISLGAVKANIFHAKKKLKKILAGDLRG